MTIDPTAALAPLLNRVRAEARADMLDALLDRYMAGEANRFNLPMQTITWLRAQSEHKARYEQNSEGNDK